LAAFVASLVASRSMGAGGLSSTCVAYSCEGMDPSGDYRASPDHTALRNSPEMLCHLGGQLGWHHRTAAVNEELERRLCCLDDLQWHVVRDLPICSVTIPIVLFGPTGVFLLQGSRGFWTAEDLSLMTRAARTLGSVMRDYPDPVRPGIVILGGDAQERQHFTGAGEGPCWVITDGRLVPWLSRYQDHGFSQGDIACLRGVSDPSRIREPERDLVPRGSGNAGESLEDFYFTG
jgi:hypothetical protein